MIQVFADSSTYRLLVLGMLAVAWLVSDRDQRATGSAASRLARSCAAALAACLALAIPFALLASARGMPPASWAGPLDRLTAVVALVVLGWAALPPSAARWRQALALVLAASAIAYAAWAPAWAQAHASTLALRASPGRVAGAWDALAGALGLLIVLALIRSWPDAPRWLATMFAALAIGSLADAVVPLSPLAPLWWRLGCVGASLLLAAAAFAESAGWRSPRAGASVRQPAQGSADAATRRLREAVPGPNPRRAPSAVPADPAPVPARAAPPPSARSMPPADAPSADADSPARPHPSGAATGAPQEQPATPDTAERIARYEVAMSRLPAGVLVTDSRDRVLFGNTTAARLLNRAQIAAGRPLAEILPDPQHVLQALQTVRTAGARGDVATDTPAPDPAAWSGWSVTTGALVHLPDLHCQIRPLRDPAGSFVGAIIVLSQRPTEASPIEPALVRRLTQALAAPMANISGYSGLVARNRAAGADRAERFLGRIEANLARMKLALANLLTAMEPPDSSPAAAATFADPSALIAELVAGAQAQIREKRLILGVRSDEPASRARADPALLAQIVDNLLANAIQRSPQGGEVTIRLASSEDSAGRRTAVLSVHDNGAPVAGGDHGLFEIDEGAEDAPGLTIARRLADGLGARTWAESTPGGMSYFVRLPPA